MQDGYRFLQCNNQSDLGDSMDQVWERVYRDARVLDEASTSQFHRRSPSLEEHDAPDGEVLDATTKFQSELVSRIKSTNFGPFRKYVSDVVASRSTGEANKFARRISEIGKNYPGNLLIVATHNEHVHVVHDCPYSNSSCRCQILKEEQIKTNRRGAIRKYKAISGIESDQWERIIQYFLSNNRWIQFVKMGGSVVRLPNGYKNLQITGHQTSSSREVLDALPTTCSSELLQEQSSEEIVGHSAGTDSGHSRKRRRCTNELRQEMEKIIQQNPVCPLAGIVSTQQWLKHPELRFMRCDHELVKSFLDAKSEELCYWSIHDFYMFYSQPSCFPTFMAGYQNISDTYYNVEDSLIIINKLLQFQFDSDVVQIKSFLQTVYDILERKLPKCNTICVWSPPSAGKNYFFDIYLQYLLNFGQLGIMNKTNNFSLQEATSKRVLLWNEPNYEDSYTDTLKMLTAGDALTVRVKQKKDCHVYKTPLIVLTNNQMGFMYEQAFRDRVITYKWKAAPFLKDYKLKPHPLVAYELLLYWEIINNKA